ncbi:MAG: 4Fe-4S dicluster domain-containing protein [Desulfobacteraceae bacterium]|nr:4Fe-4S dicluster domain-containing protein [Desulfobacteraceae bacterium]
MTLFTIDQSKCDKDGICALDCPAHIIEITKEGPAPIDGAQEFCINCGHCVAICPKGAFSLETMIPDDCMPIDRKQALDAAQTEQFLRSRRSIRRYKDKAVPADLLKDVLSVAGCAPTGSNRQPVRWLVVDQKEDVKAIAGHVIDWMRYVIENHPEMAATFNMEALVSQWDHGVDRITRDAPMLVFTYADKQIGSAPADCHTALAYLELALPGFGLGSCWGGYVNFAAAQWPPLSKMLGLPEGHAGHGAVMVGYPKLRYARAPKRNAPDIQFLKAN